MWVMKMTTQDPIIMKQATADSAASTCVVAATSISAAAASSSAAATSAAATASAAAATSAAATGSSAAAAAAAASAAATASAAAGSAPEIDDERKNDEGGIKIRDDKEDEVVTPESIAASNSAAALFNDRAAAAAEMRGGDTRKQRIVRDEGEGIEEEKQEQKQRKERKREVEKKYEAHRGRQGTQLHDTYTQRKRENEERETRDAKVYDNEKEKINKEEAGRTNRTRETKKGKQREKKKRTSRNRPNQDVVKQGEKKHETASKSEKEKKDSDEEEGKGETERETIPVKESEEAAGGPTYRLDDMMTAQDTQGLKEWLLRDVDKKQIGNIELQHSTNDDLKSILELLIKKQLEAKKQLAEEGAEKLGKEDKTLQPQLQDDNQTRVESMLETQKKQAEQEQQQQQQQKATGKAVSPNKEEENKNPSEALEEEVKEKKGEGEISREDRDSKDNIIIIEKQAEGGVEKAQLHSTEGDDVDHEGGERAVVLKRQQKMREKGVLQDIEALQGLTSIISSLDAMVGRLQRRLKQLERKQQQVSQHQFSADGGKAEMLEQLLKENEDTLPELLGKHERVLRYVGEQMERSLEDKEDESSIISSLRGVAGDVSMSREIILQHSQGIHRFIQIFIRADERFLGAMKKLDESRRGFLRDHDRVVQVVYEYGRTVDLLSVGIEERKLSKEEVEERLQACKDALNVLSSLLAACDRRMASVVGLTSVVDLMNSLSLAHLKHNIYIYENLSPADGTVRERSAATAAATADITHVGDKEEADARKGNIGEEKKLKEDHENPQEKVSFKLGQEEITSPSSSFPSSYVSVLEVARKTLLDAAKQVVDVLARLGESVTQATRAVVKARVDWTGELSTQLINHFESLVQAGKLLRSQKEQEKNPETTEKTTTEETPDPSTVAVATATTGSSGGGDKGSTYLERRKEGDKGDYASRTGKSIEMYGYYPSTREKRRKMSGGLMPLGRGGKEETSSPGENSDSDVLEEEEEEGDQESEEVYRDDSISGRKGKHQRREKSVTKDRHLQKAFRRHAYATAGQCGVGRAETDLLVDVNSEGWNAIQRISAGTDWESKTALEMQESIERDIHDNSTTILLGALLGAALVLLLALVFYGYYMTWWYQKRINAYKIGNKVGESVEKTKESGTNK